MRELTSLKKQIAILQATAAASSPMDCFYRSSEEEKRKKFIDTLGGPAGLVAQAFEAEDPRASCDYLSTLTLSGLYQVFREAAKVLAPKAVSAEERAWFGSLSHAEKIRILRSGDVGSHYKRFLGK